MNIFKLISQIDSRQNREVQQLSSHTASKKSLLTRFLFFGYSYTLPFKVGLKVGLILTLLLSNAKASRAEEGYKTKMRTDLSPESIDLITDPNPTVPGVRDRDLMKDDQIAIASESTTVVGGQLVNDLNNNGTQEEGEIGINDVTVKLFDRKNDRLVSTTTTENGGFYIFYNLPLGEYYIEIETSITNVLELSVQRTLQEYR